MFGLMRQQSIVYLFAGIASILLSCWFSLRVDVINPDAICYLQSVDALKTGLASAINVCDQAKWPFYSICIFLLKNLTGLSILHSAWVLNGLFSLISVCVFIAIVGSMASSCGLTVNRTSSRGLTAGSRLYLLLPAAVILLSPQFNDVRQYIIRDHGFWAFYLISIWMLLKFDRVSTWGYALGWGVSLVIATLFRVEGAVFLLLLPFLFLFKHWQDFLKLNIVTLAAVIAVSLFSLLHPEQSFHRLHELQFQLFHGISHAMDHFIVEKNILAQHLLNSFSARDAGILFSLLMANWYLMSVVSNVSLIFTLLVIYAWYKRSMPSNTKIFWGYILVNIGITATFLIQNMFLSKRYLLALTLVLMLWIPFALQELSNKNRRLFNIAILCILLTGVSGLFDFGYSKKYIHDAGLWLATHTPKTAKIYSNDMQTMYYSGHFTNEMFHPIEVTQKDWVKYDYIVLRLNHNEIPITALLPLETFKNKRGDAVNIYKINQKGNKQ